MPTTANQGPSFSILINSSDGFEDCWQPFFTLFIRHWKDCGFPILLNTEVKEWTFPGLQVRCTQVQFRSGSAKRLTWSECLAGALSQIKTPLVLYMQEDYFFERPVDVPLILNLAEIMRADSSIKHIGLTHFGSEGPFQPTKDPRLWEIPQKAKYRISSQAALWRIETLQSYLRPWENAWMFEIFGTRRARRNRELFLTLNRDVYNAEATPAIHYLHTGIIKGKWHPGIPKVFEQQGITIDFRKRGFHRQKLALIRKTELLRSIAEHPIYAMKSLLG